ncbi:MAG: HTTM domain-containing protein [Bdellovibrionales bacterium]|nr:HTTM domain-containing protein [Bdellovibrionales bacterium]
MEERSSLNIPLQRQALHAWHTFWHSPISPIPLGLLRILLVGYLGTTLPHRFLVYHWSLEIPKAFYAPGMVLERFLWPFPLTEGSFLFFSALMHILVFMAGAGLFTRLSMTLFSVGYWYLAAIDSAWGWHDHGPSLVVQVLVVLSLSPGVNCLSLDQLLKHLRARSQSTRASLFQPVPRWGFQLILVLLSLFYFTSGFSKLRYGGLEWMNGKTLQFYLEGKSNSRHMQQYGSSPEVPEGEKWKDGFGLQYYIYGANPSPLAKRIAESPLACSMFAIGTIIFELGFIIVLFGGTLRPLLLFGGLVFHASVYFLMHISFMPWMVIEFSYLAWEFFRHFQDKPVTKPCL